LKTQIFPTDHLAATSKSHLTNSYKKLHITKLNEPKTRFMHLLRHPVRKLIEHRTISSLNIKSHNYFPK